MRALEAPLAIGRSGVRITRASLFVLDAIAHVKDRMRGLEDGPVASRRRQAYLAVLAANMCEMHGIEVRASGRRPIGPAILVANHVSYLDPLAIMSLIPSVAIAKHEVSSWPLLGDLARDLDMLLVDRGCARSGARVLLRARTLLARGASVLVFPEGTTTVGDDVLPLRRGIFGLARRLGLPVVPIALEYPDACVAWVGDSSFLPHYLEISGHRRVAASVTIGAPILPDVADSAEALAAHVRTELRSMLRTTVPPRN